MIFPQLNRSLVSRDALKVNQVEFYPLFAACLILAKKEQTAIDTKKPPNNFFSNSPSIFATKIEQTTQAIKDGTSINTKLFLAINPFFACKARAMPPDGKKAIRFANCALFCSTPISTTSKGKVSVPPPIPIPASTPPKSPANTKNRNCIFTSYFTKTTLYRLKRTYKLPF